MPYRWPVEECLEDIVAMAVRIEAHLGGVGREAFDANPLLLDAVERCLERACEAVVRLDDRAEGLMPGHAWGRIRGLGNWLRHACHDVNTDIVWGAATEDLPRLAADAERALRRLQGGG
jgi:uncharacterized protein with HEPN domain